MWAKEEEGGKKAAALFPLSWVTVPFWGTLCCCPISRFMIWQIIAAISPPLTVQYEKVLGNGIYADKFTTELMDSCQS